MKKIYVILPFVTIIVLLILISAKNQNKSTFNSVNIETELIEIAENFFHAFENADYESMKSFCTQDCINTFFHDGDVFGMEWAKATSIGDEVRSLSEREYSVFVDVEMKPSPISVYSSVDTNTSLYIVIELQGDGSWLINKFTTG